jgi:hypothetical protein
MIAQTSVFLVCSLVQHRGKYIQKLEIEVDFRDLTISSMLIFYSQGQYSQ